MQRANKSIYVKKDHILKVINIYWKSIRMKPLPKSAINKHLFTFNYYSAHCDWVYYAHGHSSIPLSLNFSLFYFTAIYSPL